MEGWIKIHRSIKNNFLWENPHKLVWWLDMLMEARIKDGPWPVKNVVFQAKRGEIYHSTRTWADRWKTSEKTVLSFLNMLQECGMIIKENATVTTRITICNYALYQDNDEKHATDTQHLRNTYATTTQRTKESKERKKEKNTHTASPLEEEHFNFNTPEKMTTEQELDVEIFWNSLLSVYKPEGDKALYNTKLVKQQKRIIAGFTQEERSKIISWFTKYKTQLVIVNPWISNFFKTHPTIDAIANYFRSIKDVKETPTTNKNKPKDPSAVKIGKTISNF